MTSFPLNIAMSISTGLRCAQALSLALYKHLITIPHTLQIVKGNTKGKAQRLSLSLFDKSSKGSANCSPSHSLFPYLQVLFQTHSW